MDSSKYGLYQQDQDGEEYAGDEDTKARILRFIERIDGGLKPGAKLTVIGQVLQDAQRIDFDLCEHANGTPKIFHFNPRIDWVGWKNVVCLNSLSAQDWGQEERESKTFPFNKGSTFKVVIRCETKQFHISVNDLEFVEFKYRQSLNKAKYLRILGGVNVIHVDIRN